MGERVMKELLVHIPVSDFSDELDRQHPNIKKLTPVTAWFDQAGDLVVEFEAVVDD